MPSCAEQSFEGVTSEQLRSFLARAEQFGLAGLADQGESGEATRNGFTVRWSLDSRVQTLTVQCTRSPAFVPCSFIDGKIREAMAFAMRESRSAGATEQA